MAHAHARLTKAQIDRISAAEFAANAGNKIPYQFRLNVRDKEKAPFGAFSFTGRVFNSLEEAKIAARAYTGKDVQIAKESTDGF